MWNNIIGQQNLKDTIDILLDAVRLKSEQFPHCLLLGPSGCGKTLISSTLAKNLGTGFHTYNAANVKTNDIMGICNSIEPGDVVFIDEIHRLDTKSQESMYSIIDKNKIEIEAYGLLIEEIDIPKFTLIGASTSSVRTPMLHRFKYVFELEEYTDENICQIITLACEKRKIQIDCRDLVPYCRHNPRIANNIIDWLDNYSIVNNTRNITIDVLNKALAFMRIGPLGLGYQDLEYLKFLQSLNKPAGVNSICNAMNLDKYLVENKIEPYLVKMGLVIKTSTGRILNKKKYNQLVGDVQIPPPMQ